MLTNIPQELRDRPQWVLWRLEYREGMPKPTKTPYIPRPNSGMASVVKPKDWGTFEQALQAPLTCVEPVDPDTPISKTGYTGIGFVFTADDDYVGIDLDDTHGDADAWELQLKIFHEFNSYTEYSPSRTGVHIIVKGKLPGGRKRSCVEMYPQGRFFTMTGDVLKNEPIKECQALLDWLFAAMSKDVDQAVQGEAATEQTDDDKIIIDRAMNAVNGPKFTDLWEGRWEQHYKSQSEADFALMDIIAFYTKYVPQIDRLFLQSMLGQRDKAKRVAYRNYMIKKVFDRTLPPINLDLIHQQIMANAAAGANATTEPGGQSVPSSTAAATLAPPSANNGEGKGVVPYVAPPVKAFPPGLLGELAQFIYDMAPRQADEIALAGAVGFLSGICGRAYNVSNTGLNQYILLLAKTGTGKDVIASATSKLVDAIIKAGVPTAIDYKGPGEMVSSAGLIKWLDKHPCIYSVVGEVGKFLKTIASPHASPHLVALGRVWLQMYSKSGNGEVFDPIAYSDREKNTARIKSPSLTIIGESVPSSFYEALDESLIIDGLLPRFMIFEYQGKRSYFNEEGSEVIPSIELVEKLTNIVAYCSTIQHRMQSGGPVHHIPMTAEAKAKFTEFDRWTTDQINEVNNPIVEELWNRSHIKAMKLAAIAAIGDNYINPVITIDHCMWALEVNAQQTRRLIAKFDTGQVGTNMSTGEMKQLSEVVKCISEFNNDCDKYCKYGGRSDMFHKNVIIESAIMKKTAALAAFRHDRMGHKVALKRAIQTLLDADDIREMPPSQMYAEFGTKPRAFVIANAHRFSGDLV